MQDKKSPAERTELVTRLEAECTALTQDAAEEIIRLRAALEWIVANVDESKAPLVVGRARMGLMSKGPKFYFSVTQRDDGLWYFTGHDGQTHGPFHEEDAVIEERAQWENAKREPNEAEVDAAAKSYRESLGWYDDPEPMRLSLLMARKALAAAAKVRTEQ